MMNNENEEASKNKKLGYGMLAGMVMGSVYGAITDDIAHCVGLGISFGLFIGAAWIKLEKET